MKCLAFFFYDEPGWGGFLFAFLGVPPTLSMLLVFLVFLFFSKQHFGVVWR